MARLMEGTMSMDGEPVHDGEIGRFKPARQEHVDQILAADDRAQDGFTRSEWLWIRLANGDLVLGVLPQDDAYFTFEEEYP